MKKIALLSILSLSCIVTTLNSCQHAKANQQVLVSSDCGASWRQIQSGDAVPTGTGNYCFMKVVIPNYPMQGASQFISNFKEKVRIKVHIDYDYSIIDGISFMKQAKRLGSANVDVDSEQAIDSQFESAENSVIDVRLKDIAKGVNLSQDIVDLDQSELEAEFQEKANDVLKQFGVKLNFITLTFDLDEQTRQAIDVATAMRIYESKGLGELGKQVISARAGATKVSVSNTPNENRKED